MFAERGATIPHGCRARNALCFLDELAESNRRGQVSGRLARTDGRLLAAFQQTAWEFFLIARGALLCGGPSSPFTATKLSEIVVGTDGKEGRSTLARNTQFELLLASRFCLGGVPVWPGEPDLIINVLGEPIGVAAKRLTSLTHEALRKRIAQAVEQIERSGRRGLVALNLEARLEHISPDASIPEVLEKSAVTFGSVLDIAERYRHRSAVFGIIALSTVFFSRTAVAGNGLPLLDFNTPVKYWLFPHRFEEGGASQFFANWTQAFLREYLYSATAYRDRWGVRAVVQEGK